MQTTLRRELTLVPVGVGELARPELVHDHVQELGDVLPVLRFDEAHVEGLVVPVPLPLLDDVELRGSRHDSRVPAEIDPGGPVPHPEDPRGVDPVLPRGQTPRALGALGLETRHLGPGVGGHGRALREVEALDVGHGLVDPLERRGEADGAVRPLSGADPKAVHAPEPDLPDPDGRLGVLREADGDVVDRGGEGRDVPAEEDAEGAQEGRVLRDGERDQAAVYPSRGGEGREGRKEVRMCPFKMVERKIFISLSLHLQVDLREHLDAVHLLLDVARPRGDDRRARRLLRPRGVPHLNGTPRGHRRLLRRRLLRRRLPLDLPALRPRLGVDHPGPVGVERHALLAPLHDVVHPDAERGPYEVLHGHARRPLRRARLELLQPLLERVRDVGAVREVVELHVDHGAVDALDRGGEAGRALDPVLRRDGAAVDAPQSDLSDLDGPLPAGGRGADVVAVGREDLDVVPDDAQCLGEALVVVRHGEEEDELAVGRVRVADGPYVVPEGEALDGVLLRGRVERRADPDVGGGVDVLVRELLLLVALLLLAVLVGRGGLLLGRALLALLGRRLLLLALGLVLLLRLLPLRRGRLLGRLA